MSNIIILLISNTFFGLLAAFCAGKMVSLKDDLDIEKGCHRITERALENTATELRELRKKVGV